MRKLALALACASILGTSNAQAMGLGEMAVRSYLNQPLLAEIPLIDVSANDLEGIRVRLANAQAFERQGFSLSAVSGRIQVQVQGGRQPRVVLTSRSPLHDPVLGVVLELEGPDGLIQRGYDILLDPVNYRAPQQPVLPPVSGRSAVSAAPVPDVALQGGVEDGRYRVRGGDTLWRIAYNLRPRGVSTEQMMAALREANPKAFADPARNETLLSGVVLRVPETEEILRARAWKAEASAVKKAAVEAAAPDVKTGDAAAPKVAIVAPAQPVVPVVAAPVVGEVVSPPAAASEPASAVGSKPVQMQEQLEAAKVEKERLLQRLGAVEGQMEKMEELLRLKDEQIKQLEQLLQAAAVPGSQTPAPSPVEGAAGVKESQSPVPVAVPPQPEETGGLMAALSHPVALGAGGVGALLVALLIGRLRRRREEALAQAASMVRPEAPTPVAGVVAVAGAAAGGAVAASLEGEEAPGAATDPVQSALEEVDVMQAYGLHDRAREVLDEAIAHMPEADVLQARRIRLFHEMGAQEEFLRAAEEYRATHPAADDPHWGAIQAIGAAAYADAPLFGGSGLVQPETPGESAATTANEAAPELHPPFVLPEAATEVAPAALIQAGEVMLELPTASEPAEMASAEIGASEQPTREGAILESLSLKPAAAEVPSPAPVTEEAMALPEAARSEIPLMPAAEEPAMVETATGGAISEDDLLLLGLDLSNLPASEELQALPSLPAEEPAQSTLEALAAPTENAPAPVAMPAASFDERSVRLDMAQTLVDLGDLDGARSMLEEILSTQDDELSARAREMLENSIRSTH